jgi:hypothetical protein
LWEFEAINEEVNSQLLTNGKLSRVWFENLF